MDQALIDFLKQMEQRLSESISTFRNEFNVRMTKVENRLGKVEDRITALEDRITALEERMLLVENRMDHLEARVDALEERLNDRIDSVKDISEAILHGQEVLSARADGLAKRVQDMEASADYTAEMLGKHDKDLYVLKMVREQSVEYGTERQLGEMDVWIKAQCSLPVWAIHKLRSADSYGQM